jgi:hypothetical protein
MKIAKVETTMATHECSGCLQEGRRKSMRRWFFQILFVLHLEVVVTLGLEKVIISKPIYFIVRARAQDIGYIYIKFLIRACWVGASYSIFRISSPSQILNMIIYKAVVD